MKSDSGWRVDQSGNNQLINVRQRDESQPRAASYLLPSPRELTLGLVMTFREGKEKFGKRRGEKSPFLTRVKFHSA